MPDHLELWLVRHGESLANNEGRLSGWSDVHLSADGEAQARALGQHLKDVAFDGVWSSDLRRAVDTAQLAYGKPMIDRRLRELNFGELEGKRWEEIAAEQREAILEFSGYTAPGGESVASLRRRTLEFVESLPPGRHLIFSHGGAIRMLTDFIGHDRFLQNGDLIAVNWTAREILFKEISYRD